MKRFYTFFLTSLYTFFSFGEDSGLKEDLNTRVQKLIPNVESDNNIDYVSIAKEIQNWLFIFVGLVAVGYIIYIGARLLWAKKGDSEELKDAIKGIVYVALGLAIIPFAYFLVQIIVNLKIG